jgi:DNA-binding NtrC family response regulator
MVLPILQGLRSTRALEREVLRLRVRQGADSSAGLVGTSPPMQRLRDMIQRVALSRWWSRCSSTAL